MMTVPWDDGALERMTLVRLAHIGKTEVEVVECKGVLYDGTVVQVRLPFTRLPRKGYYGAMIDHARKDGVYLRNLGIFNGCAVIKFNNLPEPQQHDQSA